MWIPLPLEEYNQTPVRNILYEQSKRTVLKHFPLPMKNDRWNMVHWLARNSPHCYRVPSNNPCVECIQRNVLLLCGIGKTEWMPCKQMQEYQFVLFCTVPFRKVNFSAFQLPLLFLWDIWRGWYLVVIILPVCTLCVVVWDIWCCGNLLPSLLGLQWRSSEKALPPALS